jgi:DNA-binding NarL/FixJ family response regulator
VIIADDAPTLRATYRRDLTELGVDVVADTASVDELLASVRLHRPEGVLLDINFGGHHGRSQDDDGLVAAARLRQDYPRLGIVMFSVHMTPAYLQRITQIGSGTHIGYLGKDRVRDTQTIVEALDRVVAGEVVIDQSLAGQMLGSRRVKDPLARLTNRQRQTLELLAQGRSNKAIAQEMGVVVPTVEAYLGEVFKTLDIPTTSDSSKRVLAVLAWLRSEGNLPLPADSSSLNADRTRHSSIRR